MVRNVETILVLGSNGFIGKHLIDKLNLEYNIISVDKSLTIKSDFEQINTLNVDFTTIQNFDDLLVGVDKVVHLISTTVPVNSTENVMEEIQLNIIPTVKLLESVNRSNVKEFIFASSAGTVYGQSENVCDIASIKKPICSYGIMKSTVEDYLNLYAMYGKFKVKIIRFSNPYGYDENTNKAQGIIPIFIRKNLKGEPITIFGETRRDYIYIDDLVSGTVELVRYSGDQTVFQICTGHTHKTSEVVAAIEAATGKRFKEIIYKERRMCDVQNNFLEKNETQRILGWKPVTDLNKGIDMLVKTVKNHASFRGK